MICLKYISVLFLQRYHCARPSSPILVSMFLWVTRMAPSTKPRSYVQFSKPGALTFDRHRYLKFVLIFHVSQIQPEILLEVFLEHPRRDVAAGLPAVHGEGAVVGPLHVAQELDGSLQQKGHK